MVKKLLIGVLGLIVFVLVGGGAYLYSVTVERASLSLAPKHSTCHIQNAPQCASAQQWIEDLYSSYDVPSVSVAISVKGKLAWSSTLGYADIKSNAAATESTQYPIGSISKSLTAVGVMALHQNGTLDIDQTFQHYVTDYAKNFHQPYTLKQLLSHQSGIRHYQDRRAESLNKIDYPTMRDAANIVEKDALKFAPGTDFLYSSYAYSLLGLAMEHSTGNSYESVMQNELFSQLGLQSTVLNKPPKPDNKAQAYLPYEGYLFAAPYVNYSNKYAGAGFLSTPKDLVSFGNGLLNNTILNEENTRLLFTPVPLDKGQANPQNYALGFRTDTLEDKEFHHHGGTINGGYSFLAIYPNAQIVIAFSMNAVAFDLNRKSASHRLFEVFNATL